MIKGKLFNNNLRCSHIRLSPCCLEKLFKQFLFTLYYIIEILYGTFPLNFSNHRDLGLLYVIVK